MMTNQPCVAGGTCAVLTAPGPGAVAVIEVCLSAAADITQVFVMFQTSRHPDLTQLSVDRIIFGRWSDEDVVLVRTSQLRWEIHCHGGSIAVDRILSHLTSAGVRVCQSNPDSSHSEVDTVTATILRTLQQCRTPKAAGLTLAQLDGRLQNLLLKSQSSSLQEREAAWMQIERWRHVAEHLTVPWKVSVVGSPNVGKSSLLNAIAGHERSIVSSTPGTTRDLVEVDLVLQGWLFQLVDTAGVRDSADSSLETIGIEKSMRSLLDADLVCVVVDALKPVVEPILLERLKGILCPIGLLFNKCDLLSPGQACTTLVSESNPGGDQFRVSAHFHVSAVTGSGLPELLRWLVQAVIPEPPELETALPLEGLFENTMQSDGKP